MARFIIEDIWKEEKYRSLQGSYPVIFLSFADVKETSFGSARDKICHIIKCNNIRQHLIKLPEHHGVDVNNFPLLSMDDVWSIDEF